MPERTPGRVRATKPPGTGQAGRRLFLGVAVAGLAAASRAGAAGPDPSIQPMLHDPPPDAEALARKARSIAALRAAGVPVLDGLPTIPSTTQVRPRGAAEVAHRCRCLAVVGVASEEASAGATAMRRLGLGLQDFTPEERAFLRAKFHDERARARFGWQYECLAVLMWSLGTWTLGPPADIVDVPGLVRAFLANYAPGPAPGTPAAAPKPLAEVLDMADTVYRQHWAARNATQKGEPPLPGLNEEVLLERHRALGWLIRKGRVGRCGPQHLTAPAAAGPARRSLSNHPSRRAALAAPPPSQGPPGSPSKPPLPECPPGMAGKHSGRPAFRSTSRRRRPGTARPGTARPGTA